MARDWVSANGEVNVGEEDELLDAEDVEPLRTLPALRSTASTIGHYERGGTDV